MITEENKSVTLSGVLLCFYFHLKASPPPPLLNPQLGTCLPNTNDRAAEKEMLFPSFWEVIINNEAEKQTEILQTGI